VGYNAGVEFFFNGTGKVENCYANGEVVGDQYVGGHIGGLVGYNASVVEDCFATGAVSGNEWSGGLAGYNSGTLEKCYSIGEVSGNDYVGGLVGKNDGMVSNSFWDMDTGGMDNENGIGIGITTNSMKYYFTFYNAGWDFKGEDINGNDDIWNIGNNRNNGYPYHNWQYPYDDDPCFNPVFGGWIYAEQTICNNTIPEEFMSDTALSGYVGGPLEYKWQSSTTGATENYTDIAESNALTYASGNLVQTTWFKRLSRVTCKDSWNDAVESNVLKVTVRPELTPGSISSEGENVCSGDCPSVTIASTNAAIGGDGDISYQWQNCTNGSFSDPGIITENSDTYTPPSDLTTTTWYRRQAKDGTCSDWINSDGVWKVTVEDIPVAGILTKDPDQDAINEGVDVSVTLAPGSGGNGTDELLARSNNGTEWTGWNSYTSGVAISTFGKTVVEIRTRRLAYYCAPSEYLSVSWSVIPVHTLNITIDGNGIVEVGGEEYTTAITVTEGVMLNLEAIAAEGWLFNGWTGDVTDPAEAITTITMDTDKAITATFGPVSSSSIINLAEVVLFPNPFSSHISMSNARGVERITITNIIGQCVLDVTLQNDATINTDKLTAGVYLLTLHLANGQVEMKRMVKQ